MPQYIQTLPFPDLTDDGKVYFDDLAEFVSCWLHSNCGEPDWCAGTDLDHSGFVDFNDFATFTKYWLSDISLIGHWKMDDNADTTMVVDSSSYGNDGTAQRDTSVLNTTGAIDGALIFDGISDYVDCGTDNSFSMDDEFTICMWVKADVNPRANENEQVISKGGNNYLFSWSHRSSDYRQAWAFLNTDGTWQACKYATALSEDVWYFLVLVYDSTVDGGAMKAYLDGDLETTVTSVGVPVTDAYSLFIGCGQYSGNPRNYFAGSIDNVMLFNKTLSEGEIEELYNE